MSQISPDALFDAMKACAARTDAALAAHLAPGRRPARLVEAMQRAIFAGGKRMRPFLVIEACRLFGTEGEAPLQIACALEAIHCYSLVHDDLPAMDDDDMRRGQPTLHKAYDEATAILAGDGLLTLAFDIMTSPILKLPAGRKVKLIATLATGAGIDGMVGGQMLDLTAEGRFDPKGRRPRPSVSGIRRIQSLKTGALIEFAVNTGALVAPKANGMQKKALRTYGRNLGLAFQIRDDILDETGDAAAVGKALRKDAQAGKATFVGLLGLAGTRSELHRASEEAKSALSAAFGERAGMLNALIDFNATREN